MSKDVEKRADEIQRKIIDYGYSDFAEWAFSPDRDSKICLDGHFTYFELVEIINGMSEVIMLHLEARKKYE